MNMSEDQIKDFVLKAARAIIDGCSHTEIESSLRNIPKTWVDFSAWNSNLIHVAARYGRDFVIKELVVERNVSIMVKDRQDWTALHHSIVGNHPDTCSFIQSLCKGNEWEALMRAVTVDEENVLHLAVRFSSHAMVDFVLRQPLHPPLELTARTRSNETALFFAAESNDIGMYELILRSVDDIEIHDPILRAESIRDKRAQLLNQRFIGNLNLIHVAIQHRSGRIIRRLLSNDEAHLGGMGCGFLLETATAEGKTALHMAFESFGGQLLAADLINASCAYGDSSFADLNVQGRPCLHNLVIDIDPEAITAGERLLTFDPVRRDQHLGRTDPMGLNALHVAISVRAERWIETLLRLDVNSVMKTQRDGEGRTPFLLAMFTPEGVLMQPCPVHMRDYHVAVISPFINLPSFNPNAALC